MPPAGAAIQWQEGNATALPYAEASFDLVVCQHGLQFFPDRVAALREMRRVLAPGGRVLVIVLQALDRHPVFEALMTSVAAHLSLPIAAVATPFALSDEAQLRGLFAAAGFQSASVVPESTPVSFTEPARFVQLAVTSSAAAVPAFAQLDGPDRASLLEAVRLDVDSRLQTCLDAGAVSFPMFAHVLIASA